MRLSILLSAMVLFTSIGFAQSQSDRSNPAYGSETKHARMAQSAAGFSYSFSFKQKVFQPLESAEDLSGGIVWEKASLAIPLGFTLRFFDGATDTLFFGTFMEDRVLGLSRDRKPIGPLMVLFTSELMDRAMENQLLPGQAGGRSPILVKTVGNPGNRVTVIEFRNAGFRTDIMDDLQSIDRVSFQLVVTERTSDIEFVMGPSQISTPELYFFGKKGPSLGLIPEYDFGNDAMITLGAWFEGYPYVPSVVVADSLVSFGDTIPEGLSFQFVREDLSTANEELQHTALEAFPNPVRDVLNLKLEGHSEATFTLLDMQGKTLKTGWFRSQGRLDLSSYRAGTYLLRIEVEEQGSFFRKIIRL